MLRSAAHAVPLPQPKPRAVREHLIVPSIGGRDVACAAWPNVRGFEHFFNLDNTHYPAIPRRGLEFPVGDAPIGCTRGSFSLERSL
jgi:hypothetical protein